MSMRVDNTVIHLETLNQLTMKSYDGRKNVLTSDHVSKSDFIPNISILYE